MIGLNCQPGYYWHTIAYQAYNSTWGLSIWQCICLSFGFCTRLLFIVFLIFSLLSCSAEHLSFWNWSFFVTSQVRFHCYSLWYQLIKHNHLLERGTRWPLIANPLPISWNLYCCFGRLQKVVFVLLPIDFVLLWLLVALHQGQSFFASFEWSWLNRRFLFLQVENWCPRLPWRAKNPNEETDQTTMVRIKTSLGILLPLKP